MTTPRCPTDLALERHLLDPAGSPLEPHLAACEPCRARLARMEDEGERFRRFVFPATVERIEEAARRRPARWWIAVLAPVPILAAMVAVILAVRQAGPADDYVGMKGSGGLGLTAFMRDAGGARAVPDGGTVPANAALRLRVRTSAPCRLFVLSVDARGSVSRLDAGGADGLPLAAGQHDLPGGVELDGSTGPERLFAVCATAGPSWPDVDRAGRAAAGGGAETVRRTARLGGLPEGAAQATLLLEKAP
jgi:hypothetical protein